MSLEQAARDLALAVSGIDYDGAAVHRCRVAVHAGMSSASPSSLAGALAILVDRIADAHVADADGVAFAALTAGALVETGAPAAPLAAVLLRKAPEFLTAARRFADACLASLPPAEEEQDDEDDEVDEDQVLTEVDGRRITHRVFRAHVPADRGGASALALLQPWTLPAVAALSRDRAALRAAAAPDHPLRLAARALARSHAQWLAILLAAELDAPWLALCPRERRGFRLLVDGVVTVPDLHALLGDALVDRGLAPGPAAGAAARNPPALLEHIRGDAPAPDDLESVRGQFEFYEWRAAALGWEDADADALSLAESRHAVPVEGILSAVPRFKDIPTLIIGPLKEERSWNKARTFGGLRSSVTVTDELAEDEVASLLAEMKDMATTASLRVGGGTGQG